MQFGQVLKNVLDKNQAVWIPTIGLLAYDKATSKLDLDVYGSGNDTDLISLISEIKQVSSGQAKGILIQEVEAIKSAIKTNGKFSIDGLGDILWLDGSYCFENRKTLFPNNFFNTGNFNPDIFSNNTPPPPIQKETKKEEKVINPPKQEVIIEKKEIESTIHETEPTVTEISKVEEIKVEEVKKEKLQEAELTNQFDDNFIKIEIPGRKKEEKNLETHLFSQNEESIEKEQTTSLSNNIEESTEQTYLQNNSEEPSIESYTEENETKNYFENQSNSTNTTFLDEESFENKHLIPESNPSYDETDIYEPEQPILQEVEQKIEDIKITEPRRNIGKARYDDGYYQYSGSLNDDEKNDNRWKKVALISLLLIGFGALGAWIASHYFGKKEKIVAKKADVAQPIKQDSLSKQLDSTALAKIKSDSIAVVKAAALATTSTSKNSEKAVPSVTPPTSKTSSQPAQNNTKNTAPKTTIADPVSKTNAAVAANTKKQLKEDKGVAKSEGTVIAEKKNTLPKAASDSLKKIAKATKVNVLGKPYATANYTKGNYYLSFGKFKVPTAASKLKKDMKAKAGVETDIILVDGTYRVVIPYVSKDKAQSAAQDFPSTTLFE